MTLLIQFILLVGTILHSVLLVNGQSVGGIPRTTTDSSSTASSSSKGSTGDSNNGRSNLRRDEDETNRGARPHHTDTDKDSHLQSADACVTMYVYGSEDCLAGPPQRKLSFDTWSKPGSSCVHDVTMMDYSVDNQYCDLDTGTWYQTLYRGTDTCEYTGNEQDDDEEYGYASMMASWITGLWSSEVALPPPTDLEFPSDQCIGGFQVVSCRPGPCSQQDEPEQQPVKSTTTNSSDETESAQETKSKQHKEGMVGEPVPTKKARRDVQTSSNVQKANDLGLDYKYLKTMTERVRASLDE